MPGPIATVLIPTFNHGRLIRFAIASALQQTASALEIFLVGDGVPEETRALIADVMARDPRVRFFDNPKGPRHGEVHRHAALQEARGEIVCYLSDDDLWLPNHVETLHALLQQADFAAAPCMVWRDRERMAVYPFDFSQPALRRMSLARGINVVPLSSGAHRLEAYRRLPGWRTAPENVATDFHMWRQFLEDPACRLANGSEPTALNFPALGRTGWTAAMREAELAHWSERIATEPGRREIQRRFIGALANFQTEAAVGRVESELQAAAQAAEATRLKERIVSLEEALAAQRDALHALQPQPAEAHRQQEDPRQHLPRTVASRFWCLTAPLRAAARVVRAALGRK